MYTSRLPDPPARSTISLPKVLAAGVVSGAPLRDAPPACTQGNTCRPPSVLAAPATHTGPSLVRRESAPCPCRGHIGMSSRQGRGGPPLPCPRRCKRRGLTQLFSDLSRSSKPGAGVLPSWHTRETILQQEGFQIRTKGFVGELPQVFVEVAIADGSLDDGDVELHHVVALGAGERPLHAEVRNRLLRLRGETPRRRQE